MNRVLDILLARQEGAVLSLAILAVAIGLLVVVPVAVVVATTARSQGNLLDDSNARYLAEAGVLAVVEDLVRGADGDPVDLLDYLPPVVNFDSRVPFTTITAQDATSSPTIMTKRPADFQVASNPAVLTGTSAQGGIKELERKDNDAFELTGAGALPPDAGYGTNPQKVSFELTSNQVPFSKVEEGQVKLTVEAWDESARLEVFVYNPDDHPVDGYASTPDFSRLLDHDHFQNHSNHSHDSDHDHHNDGPGPSHDHHMALDHHHHVDVPADEHDHHHDHQGHNHSHSHGDSGDDDDDGHGHDHSTDADSDDDDLLHHHHEGSDLHLHEPGDTHGHDHQNHNHDEDDWHHGQIDVSFYLSDADLAYVSANKTLKIKVVAMVYEDLAHHHAVHGDEEDDGDDDGPNYKHDHHHHWNHDPRPPFVLATDMAAFTFVGPVVAEHRFIGPPPVINHGTVTGGSVSDTKRDDQSYYTFVSTSGASNEKIEIEVASNPFGLANLETLSVPITLRADENEGVAIEVFVFNPDAPGAGSDGFRIAPQLKKEVGALDTDRTMALVLSSEDLSYVNGLTAKQLKLKVKITGDDDEFRVQLDHMAFIATSSEQPSGLLTGATHQYIDPGVTDQDLATLPAGTSYVAQLNNVHPGLLSVNWAFEAVPNASHNAHDDDDRLTVRIFRGLVVDDGKLVSPGRYTHSSDDDHSHPFEDDGDGNDLVGEVHVHPYHGEASLQTGLFKVDSGLYTIIFSNGGGGPENPTMKTQAFAPSGTIADTWIFAASHRDYLVRSDVGNLGLTSVVRQIPGPQGPLPWSPKSVSLVPNLVVIKSWSEPVDSSGFVLDQDSDGIWDVVDGRFSAGAFIDDSLTASKFFTDQHRQGVTFGEVVQPAGMDIYIQDLDEPGKGVVISATGSSTNPASLKMCGVSGILMSLTIGDVAKATCGSLTLDVHKGPVDVQLFTNVVATVPTSGSAKVTAVSANEYTIQNTGATEGVTVFGENSSIVVAAGESLTVNENEPLPTATPTPTPDPADTPTPVPTNTLTPVPTDTPTPVPTDTPTPVPTNTPTPVPTDTPTPVPTNTPTPVPTDTPTPVPTATPTPAPTATPTPGPTHDGSQWSIRADTPKKVKAGGSFVTDGTNIFAFRGGDKDDFWRFNVAANTWTSLEDAPGNVDRGAAMVYADGFIYAFKGDDDKDFWRYQVASDSWASLADAPGDVNWGGSLAWDGADTIYGFPGDGKDDFWKFSISSGTWTALSDSPDKVKRGGSLVYVSGQVYALRGDSKKDFWRYFVAQNSWQSLASTPASVKEGGSLAFLGGDHIFALRGGGKDDFWRYSISADQWVSLTDTPDKVDDGGALVAVNSRLYALRGDNRQSFWELTEPSTTPPGPTSPPGPTHGDSQWSVRADTPDKIKAGGSLASDGSNVFAFRGGDKDDFWRFNVAANTWTSLEDAPSKVDKGGALVFANGFIFAFKGDDDKDFWRYDISSDDWQTLANAPGDVNWGGALAWDGSDTIFALRGDNKDDFWKYSISTGTWTVLADTPSKVKHGGSLVYISGNLYALRGDGKKDFWRYSVAQNTWQSLASVSASVKDGGSLASLGGDHIFALRGGGKDDFWRYSISADQWVSLTYTPDKVDDGGALVPLDGGLFALRGDNKKEFWELAASD